MHTEAGDGAAVGQRPRHTVVVDDATIGRAAAWLAKHTELALATVDLSLPQYRLLCLLDAGSAVSSALAERLAVRPPSVTAVVDGLVTRGLVERHHSEDDRRRVDHVLTAPGRRLLARADRAVALRLSELAGSLDDPTRSAEAVGGLAAWSEAVASHRARARQRALAQREQARR